MRKINMFRELAAIVILILPLSGVAQTAVWKSIKPAESTINDVERIFGAVESKEHFVRYEVREGIYYITYSDGRCVTKWRAEWNTQIGELPPIEEGAPLLDWNLPEWTVQKIRFSPIRGIPVTSLGIDITKLKQTIESPDTPGIIDYQDEDNGTSFEVQTLFKRKGRTTLKVASVTGITRTPAAQHKELRCTDGKETANR